MKMTLLGMVQDILNDMDADEVTSINDTVESQQVAQIIKTCYFDMLGNRNWPHMHKLSLLESTGDINKPNYLKLPERLQQMSDVKYNVGTDTAPDFRELKYKTADEFLRLVSYRSPTQLNMTVISDFSGVKLTIINNTHPTYWTSFDDTHIVTDSWDSSVDNTLKKSKTQCLAYIVPEWERLDESVPDLPIDAFPALLAESKSTAFLALKQMANQKAEQKAGRQNRWLSRKAWRAAGGVQYQDFGRKGRK